MTREEQATHRAIQRIPKTLEEITTALALVTVRLEQLREEVSQWHEHGGPAAEGARQAG